MDEPRSPAGDRRGHSRPRPSSLVVGGLGLAAVLLMGLWLGGEVGGVEAVLRGAPAPAGAVARADTRPIVYAGTGTQTTPAFHLAGGTYHTLWSAWERAPEYPPCTHSAELLAVDASNATSSGGHVVDLARLVHVPATGASDESYLVNVKPGDYYLAVDSACAWQIAIAPN